MTLPNTRLVILSGGPGSGKSTLLQTLEDRHYTVMPEAGRFIIRTQQAIEGTALPWADRMAFAELMLNWEIRSWHEAPRKARPVFFDRGIPDTIGYLTLCGLPVPPHFGKAAEQYRYCPEVFIAPWWPDIYHNDDERKQSVEEAVATGKIMKKTYSRLGYNVHILPKAPVGVRLDFIMDRLNIKA